MSTFWATFGEIGSLFIQTSGHSVLECTQRRAGHRRSNQSFVYSSALLFTFYFLPQFQSDLVKGFFLFFFTFSRICIKFFEFSKIKFFAVIFMTYNVKKF